LSDYEQSIRINPQYPLAYFNRGNIYFSMGNYDQAINDYHAALTINIDETGKTVSTVYALSDAKVADMYLGIYFNSGIAYGRLGCNREAIEYFVKFVAIAPPRHRDKIKQVEAVVKQLRINL
jgi:tetratricopeptide (TPR) repeat protein